jgi:hypothetical protein
MTDDSCFINYAEYDINPNDYDKGIRGLKQIWKLLVSHYVAKPEYADDVFARYSTKLLDRMGFHAWMDKTKSTSVAILMNELTKNENINCPLNYGEPYGYDVNTIICYSPWGIKQYFKRQCQAKTRMWLVRPVAYYNGDIVDESVNKIG